MVRLLIKKVLREAAPLFVACGLLVFALCWTRVWIICQFDLQKFAPLLKQLKFFEAFTPVPLEQLLTYAGSLAMTYQEPAMLFAVLTWAIARGSDVVSGELGRGTLEIMLSRPVSRTKLLLTHAGVSVVGLAGICWFAWLGLYVGIMTNSVTETVQAKVDFKVPFLPVNIPVPAGQTHEIQTPVSELVNPQIYVAPSMNLFCFGFVVLALASLVSCMDRFRWRTIGIVLGVYITQLMLFLLSKAVGATAFMGYFSALSLYQPDAMVQLVRREPHAAADIVSSVAIPGWEFYLGPAGMCLALLGLGVMLYAIGWWRFVRRDLPAPL